MPKNTRLIRVVGLRRDLHLNAVAGIWLHGVAISHSMAMCSRTNDRTTRVAIALARSTTTC